MKETCKHKWGLVLVRYKNKTLSSAARMCVECGLLKIGSHTIRLSKDRLDMDWKPIQNVSQINIRDRLKIPVGTNLYS
jgi:hypothetical protein